MVLNSTQAQTIYRKISKNKRRLLDVHYVSLQKRTFYDGYGCYRKHWKGYVFMYSIKSDVDMF